MTTRIQVIGRGAEEYKSLLEISFPDLVIAAAVTVDEVGESLGEAEILMIFATLASDALIARAAKVKWIQSLTVGVDGIIGLPSLGSDVLLTSCRGIHGPQVSEMALLLMLALNRRFPDLVRNQERRGWERGPSPLLKDKTVGIFGLGVVGVEVAAKCRAFGMTTIGIDVAQANKSAVDRFVAGGDLADTVPELDYLVLCAPYTPATENIIDADLLARMKSDSYLINVSRGQLVDEMALAEALRNRRIAGAGLDTFWQEPLPEEHPFWQLDNLILTPHVAGLSDIYTAQAIVICEENLRRYLAGDTANMINLIER